MKIIQGFFVKDARDWQTSMAKPYGQPQPTNQPPPPPTTPPRFSPQK